MQSRRIARELALLSLSQIPTNPEKLSEQQIADLIVAAIRTLSAEVKDALETASAEIQRSSDRLLGSETRAIDIQSARAMLREAIELTQTAINRVGGAVELPEFVQLSNQKDVRDYAKQIIGTVNAERERVDEILTQALAELRPGQERTWQLSRLAKIDRDILRIAVSEIKYLGIPEPVAINEAVELAKRYSGEEGHRFINGVLRRVSDKVKT
ncbi:transcription antitermination protein NusB [Planktothrix sp. FACHB-1355]|uniref:Transcription antitermination protein NusB n=1 Tax=Aerosakkonema funiforme FACHB-1375 TaxID=2949571 RepID=A0A926VE37_9CYAN|nr:MULTISPECIES: transcription antitermination factor NusB [Oscillatoriales]MBD2182221.1 transcription antitermination protein NusB [Aerosakkonema funiforme FACHB-1375]MBD3558885.1 transcription antitermination protein NusB [Planktothrix sp. FACHB-1355]